MEPAVERIPVTIEEFSAIKEKYRVETVGELPTQKGYLFLKRTVDILGSLCGLVVLIIPMIVIAIIIRMESEGNPIYKQERLGYNEAPFILYKFRSMRMDAEKNGAQWCENDDPRVTKVGKLLRKTRLDELPQLINILKGEMSIVGPRPERPEFYDIFDTYIEGFRQRMIVKPGLTGYAQVIGGYSLKPEEKIVFDIDYIKNRSSIVDIKIVLKTVAVIFKGDKSRDDIAEIIEKNIVNVTTE